MVTVIADLPTITDHIVTRAVSAVAELFVFTYYSAMQLLAASNV